MVIKTLIVDDSAFVRKVLREMLAHSPFIEVVGTASGGEGALEMVQELQPDVITCDLNMPGMGGAAFVKAQMSRNPVPIVLLTAAAQDAVQVVEALSFGAIDFIQKPSTTGPDGLTVLRDQLIQKIKVAALAPSWHVQASDEEVRILLPPARSGRKADVVLLGVSTGGPQALRYLLPKFAADFPVPLVMVLHIPIGYTAAFAEALQRISSLAVIEAYDGCPVKPKQALLAPAGHHLVFQRNAAGDVVVRTTDKPADKPHKPSVDVLFKSAAEVYGSKALGIVLTGMGNDGTEGAAFIKAQGGTVLTQSENSCVIYGMPRSVVEAGLSDAAVPLNSMVMEINKRI